MRLSTSSIALAGSTSASSPSPSLASFLDLPPPNFPGRARILSAYPTARVTCKKPTMLAGWRRFRNFCVDCTAFSSTFAGADALADGGGGGAGSLWCSSAWRRSAVVASTIISSSTTVSIAGLRDPRLVPLAPPEDLEDLAGERPAALPLRLNPSCAPKGRIPGGREKASSSKSAWLPMIGAAAGANGERLAGEPRAAPRRAATRGVERGVESRAPACTEVDPLPAEECTDGSSFEARGVPRLGWREGVSIGKVSAKGLASQSLAESPMTARSSADTGRARRATPPADHEDPESPSTRLMLLRRCMVGLAAWRMSDHPRCSAGEGTSSSGSYLAGPESSVMMYSFVRASWIKSKYAFLWKWLARSFDTTLLQHSPRKKSTRTAHERSTS
mmetsp:Transcript_32664/g.104115  ORF Transcript_32664/g.104115 Transcript_32664/m.104115 type:complete len:389 (-) Transcript_32664:1086-2252(-)